MLRYSQIDQCILPTVHDRTGTLFSEFAHLQAIGINLKHFQYKITDVENPKKTYDSVNVNGGLFQHSIDCCVNGDYHTGSPDSGMAMDDNGTSKTSQFL